MHQDNRHILWEQGDHPSTELLRQYQEDALPSPLQHQLERHLLDCDLCSDVLEGIAVSDVRRTGATVKSINQRIAAKTHKRKRRPLPLYLTDWRVAAAILLVLCSTLLVFYYNYQELNRQEQSIATADAESITEEDVVAQPEDPETESIAMAVPDTVSPTAIASAAPVIRSQRNRSAVTDLEEKEDEVIDFIHTAEEPFKLTEAVPEAPALAKTAEKTEAAKPNAFDTKAAFAPESTSVSRALAGRSAGAQIRGMNSITTNQIQGQVLSSDGTPLPGVAVTIKGTTSGVATDADGNFTINLPKDNATLAFSFIGFEREEKTVSANTQNLKVNLKEDTRSLSEVVVTGYGTAKAQPPVIVAAKPVVGIRAYKQYLEKNIRYTSESEKGRVVVQATVSPTGVLQNLQVVKSLCPACDAEALRLVKESPRWKPATRDGNATEQQVKITIRFKPKSSN
ncbi:energy transducer TonB [Pontibacter cellulosilyticus]|uniref:TonB family protein n=1 Tax=Pontibacter cellulosilyticus TaxID=1720253 RepID=A0A923SMB5_9BACT|nr:energy transducer TonB [Pontibacter cellulosilyticus]MBC5992020.1 TonB family protein [Pontibacter cellulosilyticus]